MLLGRQHGIADVLGKNPGITGSSCYHLPALNVLVMEEIMLFVRYLDPHANGTRASTKVGWAAWHRRLLKRDERILT